MHHHLSEERKKFQLDRIALFTDAVFAIAITLLILELKLPRVEWEGNVTENLIHAMWEMTGEFVGFVISFFVIGSFWVAHHTIFAFVTGFDRKLLMINLLFLLTIVVMPFTTALMSFYIIEYTFYVYSINVICAGLAQIWLWRTIANKKNKYSENIPLAIVKYQTARPLIPIACFAIGFLIVQISPSAVRIWMLSIFIIIRIFDYFFKKKFKLD
jgi:uncharacterized membrane protein